MIHQTKVFLIACLAMVLLLPVSCVKDLLDQQPTTQIPSVSFWTSSDDALQALYGAYAAVRPVFDRDYLFDGHGEFMRVHSNANVLGTAGNLTMGDAYNEGNYEPQSYGSTFDDYFRFLYGAVHRTNYVIDNVRKQLGNVTQGNVTLRAQLELIIGEARLLRGMCYFRLISMWGDVPGIWQTVYDEKEVTTISRTPIGVIKDSIMTDFTYAIDKLPARASDVGRAAKPAALAFRGKLQLYWACWNNFGWPELEGFVPSASEAQAAYAAAAADFKSVIDDYGLTLFRDGEPGEIDELGKAEKLPNYFDLFQPRHTNNGHDEFIMVFTHGGQGSSQSEELMRVFSNRSHEGSQGSLYPRYEIADRYQSTITGDFLPPLVFKNRNNDADYYTAENSTLNPQSYANRDYRMKSTILWDYEEIMGLSSRAESGWKPFIFLAWNVGITASNYSDFPGFTANDIGKTTYWSDTNQTGYMFRKFVRNYAGQTRSEGDYNFPVMRLADVYLMYAEAINEANNGPDEKAIELVNKIRHRGNLPPLAADKTATKEEFFKAVEQERIVELIAEGQRSFDIRRWRAHERVWCPPQDPTGKQLKDTWGVNRSLYFRNQSVLVHERTYIFRIPPAERERNPNLTQNKPWL